MKTMPKLPITRKSYALLSALIIACMIPSLSFAKEAGGELKIMNWLAGSDNDNFVELETTFQKSYPNIKIKNLRLTVQSEPRGAIRAALMSGEKADLIINSWPAFRAELADADMLRPLDEAWTANQWSKNIDDKWKAMSQYKGATYGLTYVYGDRSAIFYRADVLKKAGINTPPKTWQEFLESFKKLKAANITPIALPGKVWAHAEWFETLLIRTAGTEVATQLAEHKIAWTDPRVKTALQKYAEMIKAGCCDKPARMLATEWDNAADETLKTGTHAYNLIGMWVNVRAKKDYQLKEGKDYSLFQFPSMGLGHDNTSMVDATELLALKSGSNPDAANVFLTWLTGPEAAAIQIKNGFLPTSNKSNNSLYTPVQKVAAEAVSQSNTQFIIGDLLPGDLVDEYRIQLQHFLQDPSDANIDKVLSAIEEKAKSSYN